METKEPMVDDDTLEFDKEMDSIQLIAALLNYAETLENMVIKLRKKVNERTPENEDLPYFDLHSDIYESFEDYPAFERYKDYIDRLLD